MFLLGKRFLHSTVEIKCLVQLNITVCLDLANNIYYIICPQAIVKHKLVQPILEVIFQLLSLSPASDDTDDVETLITCVSHTLDIMALHLPPDILMPPLVCGIIHLYCGSQT
jgi:hypothetical protein